MFTSQEENDNVEEFSNKSNDDLEEDVADFENESEGEDEIIEENNYNSESDKSGDDCSTLESLQGQVDDDQFFIN
ncbi:hypothetical protein FQA39_LY02459 [Lamprigera yunnana]|nr:hypothetical protein FQA39_LY02459 [Lamprigera yunnana]